MSAELEDIHAALEAINRNLERIADGFEQQRTQLPEGLAHALLACSDRDEMLRVLERWGWVDGGKNARRR